MTLTRPAWWLFVVVLGAGLSVATALAYRFVPGPADLTDPLGRPSTIVRSVIQSTSEVDQISAALLAKHTLITHQTHTAVKLADDLDALVSETGTLGPLSGDVNAGTSQLIAGAGPLPALVTDVTARSGQATGVARHLAASVGGVTEQLRDIGAGLSAIEGHLDPLQPRAASVAVVLGQLEREAARLRPVGPILGQFGR